MGVVEGECPLAFETQISILSKRNVCVRGSVVWVGRSLDFEKGKKKQQNFLLFVKSLYDSCFPCHKSHPLRAISKTFRSRNRSRAERVGGGWRVNPQVQQMTIFKVQKAQQLKIQNELNFLFSVLKSTPNFATLIN